MDSSQEEMELLTQQTWDRIQRSRRLVAETVRILETFEEMTTGETLLKPLDTDQ